jgi:3-oxoacyl-[acyl-carrier-protein] synthase-3
MTSRKARIIGMGSYLPQKVLTNADLEEMVDTSDEWITSRTGVKERRIARDNEFTSDMGADAARVAMKNAGIEPGEIDLIICATATPDYLFPNTAALIQREIGATNAGAVDIAAACTGYIYALSMAKGYIESAIFSTVLVVASEKFSSVIDYRDRNTCILFGDGASASVVKGSGSGFLVTDICLGADGSRAESLSLPAGGCRQPASKETVEQGLHFVHMEGREVFKQAVRRMQQVCEECLEKAGIGADEISWLVPHQANVRIIDAMANRMGFPQASVYKKCVEKYGNNSAASIAIAVDELSQEVVIAPGDRLLLTAFGAGMTYGSALLTKVEE